MSQPTVLVVDDDPEFRESLELLVKREGFQCRTAGTLAEAGAALKAGLPDAVLIDLSLPDGNGLDGMRELGVSDACDVIVITGHATVESAVEALRQGASDYLVKPLDRARLKSCLAHVARTRALRKQVDSLRGELLELGHFGQMIGRSKPMLQLYELIRRVAPTEASVLISGESGVGKELVAQTIHALSPRASGPLLALNCGAVPGNLVESELFGHERGSFTGAERRHLGVFERASGGTLFLDEITEMPIELQVKLLRVLESCNFLRVGGNEPITANVRVLASTNRDPQEAVAANALREDLYYRLNVFPIRVPPLRDRDDDVLLLAEAVLAELNAANGTSKRWTSAALADLRERPWRGNVRELKNVVSRAFILAESDLEPASVRAPAGSAATSAGNEAIEIAVGMPISEAERRLIQATLKHCDGDKALAAKSLGISVKTLYARLSLYRASGTQPA
ncbi:MAG TPA: sigma-54 dependent transcriptional regulator [Planctomycetota bacterium]|nr:sigma-54 dependent transcriptional regulator [Planctomycetota bacterium]